VLVPDISSTTSNDTVRCLVISQLYVVVCNPLFSKLSFFGAYYLNCLCEEISQVNFGKRILGSSLDCVENELLKVLIQSIKRVVIAVPESLNDLV